MNGKKAKRLRRVVRDNAAMEARYKDRSPGQPLRLDDQCGRAIYKTLKCIYKRGANTRNWRAAA